MSASQNGVNAGGPDDLTTTSVLHPHPTWTVNLQGHVVNANAALRDYLGVSRDDLRAGQLEAAVHPDDHDALRRAVTGQPQELRLRRQDGQYRWFQVSGQVLADQGQRQGWVLAGVDIQELKDRTAQDELSQLQSIIDGSSDCIKVLDLDAQLLSMNAGGMRVMEVDDFSSCQLAFWPSFWEGDARFLVEQAVRAARDGRSSTFEGPARTRKGALRYWEVTVSPIRAQDGQVHRLLAVSRDITQRRRQQDLIAGQALILEQIATGMPLADVMDRLARLVEEQEHGLVCSIHRYDAEAGQLVLMAAPSLAGEDRTALDGGRPGPGASCCAAAVLQGEAVYATDLGENSCWVAERDLALAHGFRASWAFPILNQSGEVQGVLGVYAREPRQPNPAEQQWLSVATRLAQVSFEREYLLRAESQAQERRRQTEVILREQADVLETLNGVNQLVSAELDLERLVQAVTDAGVELTGAQFGAFFYNVVNEQQEHYTLYTLSGVPREAFSAFPMPRKTAVFGPTFAGEGVVRVDDITQDARYGQNAPYHGMPAGHLPVRSYLAVPVKSRSGEVLGGLFFGHAEPAVFSERAEQLMVGLAAQTAVALDNARLYRQLQDSHAQLERRVQDRTRELEVQAGALDAFAAFAEAVGTETDVPTLAQQAIAVLRTKFPGDAIGYYEPDESLWKLRVWTDDLQPEILTALQAGLPSDTPMIARTLAARAASFADGWDAARERVERTEIYAAVGAYPLMVDGVVRGLLSIGRKETPEWTGRDKALFSAVGRSFTLALERAAQTSHIEAQRDALDARSRALEAFALLTRDLTIDVDPFSLVRRAQEILMSLLPEGYTLYWQPEAKLWRSRSQVGPLGHPELQQVVEAGLPRGEAKTLDQCWQTGEAIFQDQYARGADTAEDVVNHVRAVAMLPVLVNDQLHGMIGVGLFVVRHWTPMDRAVLETVARSLGLALEAAESARALKERTEELERSNAELEKFAYVASHDLQEPLRTISSFSELIQRRYGEGLDERGRTYLTLIARGAERMKVLIDDLLVFSRLNAVREPHSVLPLTEALDEAVNRLHAALEHSGAVVTHDGLPSVAGNLSELTQLFQNLIGNAVKFRREGVPPRIHVRVVREDDMWHLSVQDNGIGFESQYAERVFQIFQRLHLREQFEGTGMGLAIVRKIVEHHCGRVWAESEPGRGSTFHITLPVLKTS
ncbi:GAF domain-containing protein (plasmid) [Deinococcus taeanensis]|uniref:GAF domain-containing protein n=1 Tax=Deinococcus taeanensis TaxID=2737050 RepID=UPI001CDC4543|nr:GAF domain-containing protein [Deinococcus taeanensis]UBV45315.1 GAF domain-containing protein [Deinococcus taeanensis]